MRAEPMLMHPRWQRFLTFAVAMCVTCGARAEETAQPLTITSSAFKAGAAIPAAYSCDGADQSPALSWSGMPPGTKRVALILDDPDAPAGTWVHWVVYDLPADAMQLQAGVVKAETLPNAAKQGLNDFRKIGYNGPCPPPGKPHRYTFRLYALDRPTGLPPRASKAQVLRAIDGHVVAQAELVGTYQH
jgi:Raf kinase inhibitor-like YbhB/YbcL family protein